MRYRGCFAIVALTVLSSFQASAQDLREVQQISNWPAPGLWSLTGKVMDRSEFAPEAAEAVPTAPLHFVGITPCRVADTRGNTFTGQYGPPALTPAGRSMVITGQCGIPADAQAVSFNFSAVNVPSAGFFVAYPTGGAFPPVATMTYNQNTPNLSNAAVVPLGTGGAITVVAAVATIDLVVDVNGYYRAGVVTSVTAGTGLTGGGTGAVTISVAPGGGVPSGSSVMGNPNDTTLVAAGFTETGFAQDFWKATTRTQAPTARTGASGVWTGSRMIVWGGGDFTPAFFNTGAQYDPVTDSWTPTSTTNAPTGRTQHSAVWTGSRMVVWGGANGPSLNTGGIYDPIANSWLAGGTSAANAPTARLLHTALWTGSKMIVWAGTPEGTTFLNTGGQFDPVANSWLAGGTSLTNAPTARGRHAAVWTGSQMIVWGGFDGTNYLDTGGLYNPVANSWFAGGTSTTNVPTARRFHTAVWTGSRMVVWGGFNGGNLNSGGRYDPVGNSWTATSVVGAPSARIDHTAVWTGSKMIVWGGTPNQTPGTGGLYDPAADTWLPTATSNAPAGVQDYAVVWTGSRMIVWGGIASGVPVDTGGVYAILSLYLKN